MSDRQISETAKVLIKARALIEDEKNWCQGTHQNDLGQVCAMGALKTVRFEAFANVGSPELAALDKAALKYFKKNHPELDPEKTGMHAIAELNDQVGHSAILKVYDHAIQSELHAKARGES